MRHNNHAIYLDYQATTPIDPCVLDSMLPYLTCEYGNPASSHSYGRRAASALRTARRQLGELIGTRHDNEIVFTSGATEANHLAITGVTEALRERNIIRPRHHDGDRAQSCPGHLPESHPARPQDHHRSGRS